MWRDVDVMAGAKGDVGARQAGGLPWVVGLLLPVQFGAAGDAVVFAGVDVVFAKGVAFPVLRQEDAAEVGVALEDDPHQVKCFAFVPVGARPEVGD